MIFSLGTYSNLENHPILIREKPCQKIDINQKTGLPVVESPTENKEMNKQDDDDVVNEGIEIEGYEKSQIRGGITIYLEYSNKKHVQFVTIDIFF